MRQAKRSRNTALVLVLVVPLAACSEVRSIDGTGNNPSNPQMGAANAALMRMMSSDYADGLAAMSGGDRPGPRVVSNEVSAQSRSIPNRDGASDMVWQWGQFLDHDIDMTGAADPLEPAPIEVPAGDPWFDPFGLGTVVIHFNRSQYSHESPDRPREQLNGITAWIDASNVYGSDAVRAAALRTHDGTGRLRTSAGDLLPFNTVGLPNDGGPDPALFLAGDVRANEQVGLTAMHTLFVREHNFWARLLRRFEPSLSGDELYEAARAIVGAEMQVITVREFLPALLGGGALAPYRGYDPNVDGRIANLFSTACYRFGHSMLSPKLLRLDRKGREIRQGHLRLREAFFAPERLIEAGIEPLLRGLAQQPAQNVDPYVVDDVRNFLFGPPGAGGFDLAALNIQRGRDHGLPGYNAARNSLGLAEAGSFDEVSSDPEIRARLARAYRNVDQIDVWVGGLAEDPVPGALVGELVFTVLKNQFERLRDGDRFWYQNQFDGVMLHLLERTRLSDVIRRNTRISGSEISDDVFHARKPKRNPHRRRLGDDSDR